MTEPEPGGGTGADRTGADRTGADGTGADGGVAGDEAPDSAAPIAFDRFYLETYEAMVRLARALVGSPHTAEDLVQDAFVRMHRHWGAVRDPGSYLHRCVVNACRSHHRRSGRERRHQVPAGAGPVTAGSEPAAARGLSLVRTGDAADQARMDDADRLAGPLAALPYRQRAAVVLRFYADLPDAAIASALGCRVGTVASLVHRALERLRQEVRDDD
ncbi:MAG TPA: sigma-70 family RNA polymerase sigma factor [Acidimicrobiales bacterium]|nr:sigma-70 family RNA polymerase sigma factor [Acidimicrobiales bacterium]